MLFCQRSQRRAQIEAHRQIDLMKCGLLQKCSRDDGAIAFPLVRFIRDLASLRGKAGV